MASPALRVALIGTGMIGAVHLRAARDAGAEVVGVLGSTPARSATYAAEWGVAAGYANLDELLADRPDVVQICTPNGSHFAYAMAVIRAGIAVVCEKPLAMTAAEADELELAAREAGVVATVPFAYRYHPLVRELRARRIAGEFGDVLLVHGTYLQDWLSDPRASSWRVDAETGGRSRAFADIGSHWCDLAEFLSGERFTEVSASMSIVYPTRPVPSGASFSGVAAGATSPAARAGAADAPAMSVSTEDATIATFRTASGRLANAVISQVSAGRKNRLWVEVDGSAASAVFDQENPETVWIGREDSATILHRGAGHVSADQARLTRVPAGHPQGYPDAFAAFLADTYDAIRGGSPEGMPTFADGARSAATIDAVLSSAESGAWTPIPDRVAAVPAARAADLAEVEN